mgnify:CR=1 FL=1
MRERESRKERKVIGVMTSWAHMSARGLDERGCDGRWEGSNREGGNREGGHTRAHNEVGLLSAMLSAIGSNFGDRDCDFEDGDAEG